MLGTCLAAVGILVLTIVTAETTGQTETNVTYKYCKPWKWKSVGPGTCQRCPGCKRGYYHDNSTLGPLDEKRGALTCHGCTKCPEGKYSDQHTRDWEGFRYCRLDRNCTKKNRVYNKKPRKSRKSECGACLDGYVRERNWDDKDGNCYKPENSTSKGDDDGVLTPTGEQSDESDEVNDEENLGALKETVQSEAEKNRSHQEKYNIVVITACAFLIFVVTVVLFLMLKKKVCSSREPHQRTRTNVTLNENMSSSSPLMEDGDTSQTTSPIHSTESVDTPPTVTPIQATEDIGVPKVTIKSSEISVKMGSKVTLQSSVNVDVNLVAWKRICEDQTTDIDVKDQKYSGSSASEPSLTINGVSHEDAGVYQCTAVNSVGTGCSLLCHLKINVNPDLELTSEEKDRAGKIKLEVPNKMIKYLASVANDDQSEEVCMMHRLYKHLNIPPHRVRQIYEDFRHMGVTECVHQTLNYYIQLKGRDATIYNLYEALKDCRYFYELKFYVQEFRKLMSTEGHDTVIEVDNVGMETEDVEDNCLRVKGSLGNPAEGQRISGEIIMKIDQDEVIFEGSELDH